MPLTHDVVVSIGTNHDREVSITKALDLLEQGFGGLSLSSVYESASSTSCEIEAYYNLVAKFVTDKSVEDLQGELKHIEEQCGRDRTQLPMDSAGQESIAMDIDLLLYDEQVTDNLPHSDILNCAYVLRPLSELLPAAEHPQIKKTFADLWEQFSGDRQLQAVDLVWRDQLVSVMPPVVIFQ